MFFKKDKYLDCHFMKHSIHFFYDMIKTCCTNINGPILYDNYNGEKIDWDYVYKFRKKMAKEINSIFNKDTIPKICEGCYEINNHLSDKKIKPFENKIDRIYFHNVMSCNAKCNYCVYSHIEKGYRYNVVPFVVFKSHIGSPFAIRTHRSSTHHDLPILEAPPRIHIPCGNKVSTQNFVGGSFMSIKVSPSMTASLAFLSAIEISPFYKK